MGKANNILFLVGFIAVGLVLGLSSYYDQAQAGMPSIIGEPCDSFSGVLLHWDKIIFHPEVKMFNTFAPSPLFPPTLFTSRTYDIKVEQDPASVTNLEGTVAKFLNANGFRTSDGKGVSPKFIDIVDVEYAIACTTVTFP